MEVKLVVLSGKHAGRTIMASASEYLIGRAENCHLQPQSKLVGLHHCAIVDMDGLAMVRDLGSPTGTWVNGEPVTAGQDRELKAGDHLKIGPLEFEVHLVVSVSGKKRPIVHNVQEAAARFIETATRANRDVIEWLDDEDEEECEPDTPVGEAEAAAASTPSVDEAPPPEEAAEEATEDSASSDPIFGPKGPAKKTAGTLEDAAAKGLKQYFKHTP